jgi:hypothetical protein
MEKPKRKRLKKADKVPIKISNDGMNTPVRDHDTDKVMSKEEIDLYKQAENPLGDPHKK